MAATIGRPSPVPPVRRRTVRPSRSNRVARSAAAIPGPSSRTHSTTSWSRRSAPISMRSPSSVTWIALSTRFSRAWVSRCRSPADRPRRCRRAPTTSARPSPPPCGRPRRRGRRSPPAPRRGSRAAPTGRGPGARSTRRSMRSISSSTRAIVAACSSGSSSSSSTWPRTMVIGVRSSCAGAVEEAALAVERHLQPVEHAVEGRAEVADLVVAGDRRRGRPGRRPPTPTAPPPRGRARGPAHDRPRPRPAGTHRRGRGP